MFSKPKSYMVLDFEKQKLKKIRYHNKNKPSRRNFHRQKCLRFFNFTLVTNSSSVKVYTFFLIHLSEELFIEKYVFTFFKVHISLRIIRRKMVSKNHVLPMIRWRQVQKNLKKKWYWQDLSYFSMTWNVMGAIIAFPNVPNKVKSF